MKMENRFRSRRQCFIQYKSSMKKRLSIFLSIAMIMTAVFSTLPSECVYADGIGQEEYMNDDALISIVLPYDTKYIGKRAYYGCENLESVTIPYGCTKIGESAFAMCPKLYYVSIPPTVKTIEPGAFAGDTSLKELTFNGTNNNFYYTGGVLYDKYRKELISYLPGNERKVYHMPDSVKKIDKYAFWGAECLEKVVVSDQPTTITPYDFAFCSGLKYIYMPSFIKSVQEYAFRDCKNLEYLYFGYKNVVIDPTAFFNCDSEFSTVSGQSADVFNEKFAYSSELEDMDKGVENIPETEKPASSGSASSNSASGNSASSNSASGNNAGGTSGSGTTAGGTSGSGTAAAAASSGAPSTVGKWDPATTTYVTRNPNIKSGVDALTNRLNGIWADPYISSAPVNGGVYTPIITLPK